MKDHYQSREGFGIEYREAFIRQTEKLMERNAIDEKYTLGIASLMFLNEGVFWIDRFAADIRRIGRLGIPIGTSKQAYEQLEGHYFSISLLKDYSEKKFFKDLEDYCHGELKPIKLEAKDQKAEDVKRRGLFGKLTNFLDLGHRFYRA